MARPRVPRIGCAGWSIPAAHRTLLGAGDSMLARYATAFDCVEINSSFYRPHRTATYERWASSVPRGFRFAVKLPGAITHEAGLVRCAAALDRFFAEAGGLGSKLAVVLVQLPPSLRYVPRTASTFFAQLRRRYAGGVAVEPRHASWFGVGADVLWQRHRIARVAADPSRAAGDEMPGGDASLRYWRWHGSPHLYRSRYEDDRLEALATAIRAAGRVRDQWVIFDNTAGGHAAGDAARLQARFGAKP